jgi:hypothetical protein
MRVGGCSYYLLWDSMFGLALRGERSMTPLEDADSALWVALSLSQKIRQLPKGSPWRPVSWVQPNAEYGQRQTFSTLHRRRLYESGFWRPYGPAADMIADPLGNAKP